MIHITQPMVRLATVFMILSLLWPVTVVATTSAPPKVQLRLDKSEVVMGEPITVTWVISGGDKPPYTYNQWSSGWIVYDSDPDEHQFVYGTVTGNSNTWVPAFGARAHFSLSLLDADGDMPKYPEGNNVIPFDTEDVRIVSDKVVTPLQITVTLDKDSVSAGAQITATVQASGGEPPYSFEFDWGVSDLWQGPYDTYKSEKTASTSSVFGPQFGAYGRVWVTGTDSKGRFVNEVPGFSISGGQTMDQIVTRIADECRANASGTYARVKWLNDYLMRTAQYDYTYTHYSPRGVLMLGTGVCQSYATAYQMLLNKLGITNRYITGDADGLGGWGGHAWNLLNIGGDWYHVDVTWNDGTGGYKYFLRSDKAMSADHRWDTSKFPPAPYDWGKAPAVNKLPGDANDDKQVDVADALCIITYITSNIACTSMENADLSADGIVDILDLTRLIDLIAGG